MFKWHSSSSCYIWSHGVIIGRYKAYGDLAIQNFLNSKISIKTIIPKILIKTQIKIYSSTFKFRNFQNKILNLKISIKTQIKI